MAERFNGMLRGGHHNSLGRTQEVVDLVLADPGRLEELLDCLGDCDPLVRMRAGDGLEKVCRREPVWFAPYVERLLTEVAGIDQASVQWHLAQMLQQLGRNIMLTGSQRRRATKLLRANLTRSSDWIVLNVTIDVLAEWAGDNRTTRRWLLPELERLSRDDRKSVARRAEKRLLELGGQDGR